ncbi:MAG: MATE family efflux transporter, partial [Faecalibacillus sp.]
MKNLTEGNSLKLIFLFALPLMFGNLLQQLYTMVDTMIVGQFVGVDALASIGGADWITWAILGLLIGFTQGFSIRVSNCLGANDEKGMEKAIAMTYMSCLVIGLIVMIVSQLIIVPLLQVLNTPNHTIQGSILYLRIISSGSMIVIFYNCFSSILRAIGDSKTPLRAMVIAACMNIILDLIAVCIFHLGIAGAALATIISQLFAAIYCYKKLNKELPFQLTKESFHFNTHLMKQLIYLGTPLAFQNIIIAIGGIILQSVVNGYGFLFIAGYTATNKFYGILEVVSISFGYAITTFTSQNYGAQKYQRMKQGIFQANLLSVGISIVILFIVILFGKNVLMLFISATPQQTKIVLKYAYDYLFVMAACLPVLYVLYSYRSALQGMENTFIPMVSGIVELIMRVTA